MTELKAGRELDALVAEKVLGWKRGKRFGNGNGEWEIPGRENDSYKLTCYRTPDYSTDIAAAWEIVEKLSMWVCPANNGHDWTAGRLSLEEPSPEGGTWAETAPHAICLAALKAVESRATQTQGQG